MNNFFEGINEKHLTGVYCQATLGLVWSGLVWSGLVWSGLVWGFISRKITRAYCALFGIEYNNDG